MCFFFFKQKTAYEMRISDWSSDVCSSDLGLERMLDALGVLAPETPLGPAPSSRLLKVDGAQHYIFAPAAGIFEPAFTLGDEVQAGQFAGRIHDPRRPQAVPAEIFFEAGGLAICTRTLASVEPGDCLGHLASDTAWP